MRRLRTSLLAGVMTVCTAWVQAADISQDLKIKNLMPEFWSFQDQASQLQTADRILRRFREQLIDPNRDIYARREFKDAITDQGILDYLKTVSPDLPTMRALSGDLESLTRESATKLKREFRRFDARLNVVFMPSFQRLDCQYTRIVDQPTLLFGLDAIVRYRGPQVNWRVLLTHELFHAHHARVNAELYRDTAMPLYARVWTEGLATYVSERLNPAAPSQQIIGDSVVPTSRDPALMGTAVGMILISMDSISPAEHDKFLTYTAATDGVPVRAGNFVGYEIAKALAAEYELDELTALRGAKLRELMSEQLAQMSASYLAQQRNLAEGRAAGVP
jgi:hypothetical protein